MQATFLDALNELENLKRSTKYAQVHVATRKVASIQRAIDSVLLERTANAICESHRLMTSNGALEFWNAEESQARD
jgi:hypothetical protein